MKYSMVIMANITRFCGAVKILLNYKPKSLYIDPSWPRIISSIILIIAWWILLFWHEEIITWYKSYLYGTIPIFSQHGKYTLFRIILTLLAAIGVGACVHAGIWYHNQNRRK